ncbi:hypothetical protein [Paraclostridium sordellii]|uniref:hypothetical protein n=1 Tax=Paraclostridium sordellii TaxID=1505 RepID=UPI0005E06C40|nr:hypothetical protein [Paeniclostridium sordellii]CEQ00533.1 Uncharacterised protein [[Clostridium] sordellii] [Paeniclostridium sordellii]
MNLIDYADKINEKLKEDLRRVEIDIIDFRNKKYTICFWEGQDIVRKAFDIANQLGDGHEVINIRGYK